MSKTPQTDDLERELDAAAPGRTFDAMIELARRLESERDAYKVSKNFSEEAAQIDRNALHIATLARIKAEDERDRLVEALRKVSAASPDETGWVIVRDSAGKGLRYWDGAEFRMENLSALRFARKVDAERYLELMHFDNDYKARVEEHMWINAPTRSSE